MAEELEYKKVAETINDYANDNLNKLAQLFPAAVKDGEVDFEALKQELGAFKEVGSEKYELTWSGKQKAKKVALEDVSGKTLNYAPEDSKNPETTENLYIEGDNLEVLKLLRQNYYGAIKMIYIDPPYNTGNDFVYNDNFTMSIEESEIAEDNRDELGGKYQVNSKSYNRYHANWLNMMYPRLKIAKDLLTEDGVIFISIDDNEITNVRKICDDVLGEENFIQSIIWKKRGSPPNDKIIGAVHEYILLYAKNINETTLYRKQRSDDQLNRYKNPDNHPKGRWAADNLMANVKGGRYVESLYFPIVNPATGEEHYPSSNGNWRFNKEKIQNLLLNNEIYFGANNNGRPKLKRFLCDVKDGVPFSTLFDDVGYNNRATAEMVEFIGGVNIFDTPKPTTLIYQLLKLGSNKKDLILDFFSGTATTAHAVMKLNAEDDGERKFIMIQLPEPTSVNSEAYKADFKNICDIGKERIRRAGEKIIAEKPELKGKLDIGFKVFKVSDTNIKWNHQTEIDEQFTVDTAVYTPDLMDFMPGAKDEDIVYEVMLRQNDVPLSSTLEILTEIGQRTYLYASSYLVCLETEITVALVDKLAALNPLPIKFIFRDSAFQDDIALKDETFRRLKALIEKNAGSSKKTYTIEFI